MPIGLGASIALGPGALYVEAAYAAAGWHYLDLARLPVGGGLLGLGYRLAL